MNEIELQKAMIEGLKERKLKVEKKLEEIQSQINERQEIVEHLEQHEIPIIIDDRLNPSVRTWIRLLLTRIGFENRGTCWFYKGKEFNSYPEVLKHIGRFSSTAPEFEFTQDEKFLIARFERALHKINSLD